MGHGGKRPGAGRKPNSEATKVVRIPVSRVDEIRQYLASSRVIVARGQGNVEIVGVANPAAPKAPLPIYASKVPAGFPSPADDYAEGALDLNDYLVEHEAATYYVRVQGHSMTEAGILDGDIIAVDRALEPRHGDIVVAIVDNELTVKELSIRGEIVALLPRHPDYAPITFRPDQSLTIWGVVKGVVRKLR